MVKLRNYKGLKGDIGNPGDSILIAIPRIDSIVNTWDVLGDYRRPNWYCIQSSLLIKNDTLSGLLKGIYFSGGPIATNIDKYSYPKFKLNWVQSVIHDCNTVVGVIEKFINESINIFPNPTLNNLNVQINNFSRIQDIQVFNLLGKEHKISWTEDNKTKATINTVAWPKGVYLIQVKTNEGIVSKKIVKS